MTGKTSMAQTVELTHPETIDDGKVKEKAAHQPRRDNPGSGSEGSRERVLLSLFGTCAV